MVQWVAMPLPLLSGASLPRGSGFTEWEYPAMLRPLLAAPRVWARLNLDVCVRSPANTGEGRASEWPHTQP